MRAAMIFLLVCGAIAAAAFLAFGRQYPNTAPRRSQPSPPHPRQICCQPPATYLGVAVPLRKVKNFGALTGQRPDLYEEYTGFGGSFTRAAYWHAAAGKPRIQRISSGHSRWPL